MARLKKGKIKKSKAGKAFKSWDTDYISAKKGKRTYKTSSKPVKNFKR